ncbi:MAG TPA: OmpA family protein [Cytophagaceae bacterium]|jgi:outer membrane protein OmpA-like peptidoglycan-associated protein
MTKTKILLLLSIALSTSGIAQNSSIQQLLKEGDDYYQQEMYRNALPFYEKGLETEPENAELLFKAGVCYLNRYSKEKALSLILKAYNKDSTADKHMHYWLGRVYHENYAFDKAFLNYSFYKKEVLGSKDSRHLHLDDLINQTQNAKKLIQTPKDVIVKNLGSNVNSTYSEHSPVISSDGNMIMYTSRRETVTGGKEDNDGEYFEDIFVCKKGPEGEWSKPEILHLNTHGHDASVQLFENDQKLLIYRGDKGGGDIYISTKEGENWSEPLKFGNINTKDFEADAFVTQDGNRVYYATNFHKKEGDLDIHYSEKNHHGHWSHPHTLQGGVNSDMDEMAPYVTKDGKTLYFSSRGNKSMGGYDIFKSVKDANNHWSEPENLGYPINTPDDDVYFYQSPNGISFFMASYREGGLGEKDIYEVSPFYAVTFKGQVISKEGTPLANVKVEIINANTKEAALVVNTNSNGAYETKLKSNNSYSINILKQTDTLYREQFEIPASTVENSSFNKIFNVDYKTLNDTNFVKSVEGLENTTISFKNIYFPTGKFELNANSKAEMNAIKTYLSENPKVKLEIYGHADKAGERESVNELLSERRAMSAAFYLIQGGIKASRIKYVGYGSKQPMSENNSPLGMAQNRRIEFKLIP